MPSSKAPAVLVMNLFYTGIGIGRNLRGTGIRVDGLSAQADAPGARSRLFQRVVDVPSSREDPQALCARLLAIRADYAEAPVIFPTSDADVLFLADAATALAPHYRLPSGLAALPRLLDKLKLATLAEEVSIPAPKTIVCVCEEDIQSASAAMTFPLVMKPRSAHEWRKKGMWLQVGARKAIPAASPDELIAEYRKFASFSPEVLLQEFVPGEDYEIVVCCCYIDEHGDMLGHFTGRKLRQNPPLFGTGCLVEATPVPEIVESSRRLLHACGYWGIAEVEFKRDPSSGRFLLIEVNPRHWDQHQLGTLVGVNLTRIAYDKAIGRLPPPCLPRYPAGRAPRWIAEQEALLLLARNAYREVQCRSEALARSFLVDQGLRAGILGGPPNGEAAVRSVDLSLRDPIPGVLLLIGSRASSSSRSPLARGARTHDDLHRTRKCGSGTASTFLSSSRSWTASWSGATVAILSTSRASGFSTWQRASSAASSGTPIRSSRSDFRPRLGRLIHLGDQYVSNGVLIAAERLATIAPVIGGKVIFLSTGSEANECAMRMAKAVTGRTGMLGFTRGYYGITLATRNLSSISEVPGKVDFQPAPVHQHKLLSPSANHCPLGMKHEACTGECLQVSLEMLGEQSQHIAAVIVEPILSAGGMIFPSKDYLQELHRRTKEIGALFICDESQTALGRCGTWFDIENVGLSPDIVVLSKTAGNGYPIGAIVVSDAVARTLEQQGFSHLSSHQNDPLAAAVVHAVIDTVEEENLISNSRVRG